MGVLNRAIRKGADEAIWFVYCEPDGVTPRSLAGVDVSFVAKTQAYGMVVAQKDLDAGVVVTDEPEGEGEVRFDEADFPKLSSSTTVVASLRFVEGGRTVYEDFNLTVKVGA